MPLLAGLAWKYKRSCVEIKEDRVCSGCGKKSPPAASDYTLISPRYGWRLLRKKNPDETYLFAWYCPKCWSALKEGDKGGPTG